MVPGKPGHGAAAARGVRQKHALSQHDNEGTNCDPCDPQNLVTPTFDRAVQPSTGALPIKMEATDLAATLLQGAKDSI